MMWTVLVLAASQCLQPVDSTPGWKQLALPAHLPHLAAPADVSQFRSDERFTIVEQQTGLYTAGQRNGGATDFVLSLGKGARSVDVVFQASLRGAKVDVTSWGKVLLHEKRIGGDRLSLEWGDAELSTVVVSVHHHLRAPPVLMELRVARFVTASELDLPMPFRQPRSLFYFQRSTEPLALCEAPGVPLHVTQAALAVARAQGTPVLRTR